MERRRGIAQVRNADGTTPWTGRGGGGGGWVFCLSENWRWLVVSARHTAPRAPLNCKSIGRPRGFDNPPLPPPPHPWTYPSPSYPFDGFGNVSRASTTTSPQKNSFQERDTAKKTNQETPFFMIALDWYVRFYWRWRSLFKKDIRFGLGSIRKWKRWREMNQRKRKEEEKKEWKGNPLVGRRRPRMDGVVGPERRRLRRRRRRRRQRCRRRRLVVGRAQADHHGDVADTGQQHQVHRQPHVKRVALHFGDLKKWNTKQELIRGHCKLRNTLPRPLWSLSLSLSLLRCQPHLARCNFISEIIVKYISGWNAEQKEKRSKRKKERKKEKWLLLWQPIAIIWLDQTGRRWRAWPASVVSRADRTDERLKS